MSTEVEAAEARAYSLSFYHENAARYSDVYHQGLHSVFTWSDDPSVGHDFDLLRRLTEICCGGRGLDAGCGAGARDVHWLWTHGFDITGIDAVEECVEIARKLHPEIADRVVFGDLRNPLPLESGSLDFIVCKGVIQHISPETTIGVVLPEFARVLRSGGLLKMFFKLGKGVSKVFDRLFGLPRYFQLYEQDEIRSRLHALGFVRPSSLVARGVADEVRFVDPKAVLHCAIFVQKR